MMSQLLSAKGSRLAAFGEEKILSPRGFWDYLHSQP